MRGICFPSFFADIIAFNAFSYRSKKGKTPSNPAFRSSYILGGGFKYLLFSTLLGEIIQFDQYFSNGLKPPTSIYGWENKKKNTPYSPYWHPFSRGIAGWWSGSKGQGSRLGPTDVEWDASRIIEAPNTRQKQKNKGLGGGFILFFIFTPKIEEDSHFDEHIFQMGWKHQLEEDLTASCILGIL